MLAATRIFAGLYGLTALAGSVVLALFFALETSMLGATTRGDVFGPLSDWGGVVASVPLSVAVVLFAGLARARWWFQVLTGLVVIATIVFAVVSWLFIEGRLTLGDQFAAAGPQISSRARRFAVPKRLRMPAGRPGRGTWRCSATRRPAAGRSGTGLLASGGSNGPP